MSQPIFANELVIFDEFVVDKTLREAQEKQSIVLSNGTTQSRGLVAFGTSSLPVKTEILVRQNKPPLIRIGNTPWYLRLWERLTAWLAGYQQDRQRTLTVEQFFSSVKNTTKELEIVAERAKGYEISIQNAKFGGQRALMEQLQRNLNVARAEAQLFARGYKKYVTEETLVQFVKKCEKGLRLDWVANFARVIPDDVLEKKKRTDELGVFDNYVVLHYDPQGKAWMETEEARRKRKDPILFGVIQGSRKLYFIADWIDEVCDLTLDGIAELMGKKAIETLK